MEYLYVDLRGRRKMLKAHGTHVLVDYTNFFPNVENIGNWMLSLMEQVIDESTANRVHSYVAHFDGKSSSRLCGGGAFG